MLTFEAMELPLDTARTPRPGEAPDRAALEQWLQEALGASLQLEDIQQFPGGYSNLTYLLQSSAGEFVMRRPPYGANIRSAHDMAREYRVLSLLKDIYPLAPRPVALCEDPAVLGAPFYLMERVRGVILRPGRVPQGMDAAAFRRLSAAAINTLCDLHALELNDSGLMLLGKPEGYAQRQVEGWIQRYRKAETDAVPDMDQLAGWLPANLPPEAAPAFIHNDFKYDNLVLDPAEPGRILAVLDWEMATVGDPLMDLGTSLAYWVGSSDSPALQTFNLTALPGNFSRAEAAEYYAARSGRSLEHLLFYYAFGCFKLGVIVQQIYARYRQGHTQDARFAGLIEVLRACAANGSKALDRGKISG